MQVVRSVSIPRNQVRLALVSLRFGLATGSWLAPRWTGRLFGLEPNINPVSPYLARLFGARAAWLGTGDLTPDRGHAESGPGLEEARRSNGGKEDVLGGVPPGRSGAVPVNAGGDGGGHRRGPGDHGHDVVSVAEGCRGGAALPAL